MPDLSPFSYSDYGDFLSDYVKTKKTQNRSYSYKVLAKLAEIRSHSLLNMIANKRRLPSEHLIQKLNKLMGLSAIEREYINAIVKAARAKNDFDRNIFISRAKEIQASTSPTHSR